MKTNSNEKDALDEAIAKFFYTCSILFVGERKSIIYKRDKFTNTWL